MIIENMQTLPFWWLETAFGKMVFTMFFLTWGLIIVALVLCILALLKYLLRARIDSKN